MSNMMVPVDSNSYMLVDFKFDRKPNRQPVELMQVNQYRIMFLDIQNYPGSPILYFLQLMDKILWEFS